jgi:hypothetical protein
MNGCRKRTVAPGDHRVLFDELTPAASKTGGFYLRAEQLGSFCKIGWQKNLCFSCFSFRFFEAHTGSTTVLVNKFDACRFESSSDYVNCGPSWLVCRGLKLTNGYDSDGGFVSKLLLAPIKKPAGSSALFGRDHN